MYMIQVFTTVNTVHCQVLCSIFNQSTYNTRRHRTLAHIKTTIKIFQFTNWKAFTTNVIIFILITSLRHIPISYKIYDATCTLLLCCKWMAILKYSLHYDIKHIEIIEFASLLVDCCLGSSVTSKYLPWFSSTLTKNSLLLPLLINFCCSYLTATKESPHVFIDEYSPKMTWLHPLF